MSDTTRRPIRIRDLIDLPRAVQPRVSPDGGTIVFAVKRARLEENRNETQLYRVARAGGEPAALTREGSNSDPAFSPDGTRLAFTSTRGGTPQVWILPLAGGEPWPLTRLRLGARRPVWFPDGSRLLVTSPVYLDTSDEVEVIRREEARARGPMPRVIDSLMFRHWDAWTEGKLDHLFAVDAATGEARDLTPGPYPVPPRSLTGEPDYAVSPDGTEVCFVSLRHPAQALSTSIGLWTMPAGGGEPRRVSLWPGVSAYPTYSPDGTRLAYCGMRRAGYEADRRELLVYDRRSGETLEVAAGFDRSVGPPVWSPDGERLYFAAQDAGRTRLWVVEAGGGKPEPLTQGLTDHDPVVTPDGRHLVFTRESMTAPPEVHRVSTEGGDATPVTAFSPPLLGQLDLVEPEDFWFEGAKGARVHGYLLRPPGFDAKRRYPTVFLIHGGPQAMFGHDFHERWNAQLFAAAGRVVVMINPRGSTGYGQAFTDAIRGEWGGDCHEDLVRGFDHVLAAYPFCDRERTAAAGASFGGYMVNWIAGQSDRFRCLVSHDGMFDTAMLDYATDELWFTEWELGGAPWEAPEGYRKWSPADHVAAMKTPMLVIQGEQDFRCPIGEGLNLFTALQRRGVPSRLLFFPDEGHWVLKPGNRKVWWETVLGWLERWLA